MRPAIVLVDIQNDFVIVPQMVKRAKKVISPFQRLVTGARINNVPVGYSVDSHYVIDVEVTRKWDKHAIKGTVGAEVIAKLEPDKTKDYVVEKLTYSGFYEIGF